MEHPGQFQSVHVGHENIRDDQIDLVTAQMIEAVFCRRSLRNAVSGSFQDLSEILPSRGFFIDHKDFSHRAPIAPLVVGERGWGILAIAPGYLSE